ncbi:unnamed protein product [Adineta ricciae]|uniref:Uncharacterized protein n=1 Tax=Adineta ricciae TaxID=249248 RepID=A0A816EPH4_ADIRI|nr:unnamed protein product [Adineta ricciae]
MKIDLELIDWKSPPNIQSLTVDERLFWGDKKRQMGNFYYRRRDYSNALQCYRGALRFLDVETNLLGVPCDDNQRSLLTDSYIQVQNNVAQVNLFLNKYEACLNAVENVLKYDSKNVKALFRQGKALFELGKYDQALQPLKSFAQIQRGNSNAAGDYDKVTEMITTCENKLANYQKKEKEIYRRMFQPAPPTTNQQRQTKVQKKIDNASSNTWLYIGLGGAALAAIGIFTFMKYRKTSIESLTIDINASPLQVSCWPYLPRLSTLRLLGVREYNDVITFLLLHAATLTHLTIDTRFEIESSGVTQKYIHPKCDIISIVKNIIFRHLHSLRSLDFGPNDFNGVYDWRITHISARLTFLRVSLWWPSDVVRLISTPPLPETLKYLYISLSDITCGMLSRLPNKQQLAPMKQLRSFTFMKSFIWRFDNELAFIELLTCEDIMPMLQRVKLSIILNNHEFDRFKQCSIFNDHRCIDVHFALCIEDYDRCFNSTDLIPHGSFSYPKEVRGSALMVNYWYNIGYSTTVSLSRKSRYQFDRRWVWYTHSWSFQTFYMIPLLHQCNHEQELYATPSSFNSISPLLTTQNLLPR